MPYGATGGHRALKANFGSANIDAVGTLYVALMRQATPADVSTVLGTEPTSVGNYGRVAVLNTDAKWEVIALAATNLEELRWPIATALYSVGAAAPLNQWAIYDLAVGGNLVCWGVLSPTIEVTGAGDQPVLPVRALGITQVL